jgi:hypothetical protein
MPKGSGFAGQARRRIWQRPRKTLEFHAVKLRKTKTAERFWFAQGIEAVSFCRWRRQKIQADSPVSGAEHRKCAQKKKIAILKLLSRWLLEFPVLRA